MLRLLAFKIFLRLGVGLEIICFQNIFGVRGWVRANEIICLSCVFGS